MFKAGKAVVISSERAKHTLLFLKKLKAEIDMIEFAQIKFPYPEKLTKKDLIECIIDLENL